MAKKTLIDAIKATLELEAVKLDPTLSPEERQAKGQKCLDIVGDSNLLDLGGMGDEAVEIRRAANEMLEGVGVDAAALRRQAALAGPEAIVAAIQQGEDVDLPMLEG